MLAVCAGALGAVLLAGVQSAARKQIWYLPVLNLLHQSQWPILLQHQRKVPQLVVDYSLSPLSHAEMPDARL